MALNSGEVEQRQASKEVGEDVRWMDVFFFFCGEGGLYVSYHVYFSLNLVSCKVVFFWCDHKSVTFRCIIHQVFVANASYILEVGKL